MKLYGFPDGCSLCSKIDCKNTRQPAAHSGQGLGADRYGKTSALTGAEGKRILLAACFYPFSSFDLTKIFPTVAPWIFL